jgi:hypothetical protein
MAMTFSLDSDQEQRVHEAALARGLDDNTFLNEVMTKILDEFAPRVRPTGERKLGLNAMGVQWIADDFDAPLPDSFWLGNE